jgi:hypothetical protein
VQIVYVKPWDSDGYVTLKPVDQLKKEILYWLKCMGYINETLHSSEGWIGSRVIHFISVLI